MTTETTLDLQWVRDTHIHVSGHSLLDLPHHRPAGWSYCQVRIYEKRGVQDKWIVYIHVGMDLGRRWPMV